MIDEDPNEEQQVEEPEVKKFTDTDLIKWISILFVFGVYVYIFLKIIVLS
jgi:hypothetical protein